MKKVRRAKEDVSEALGCAVLVFAGLVALALFLTVGLVWTVVILAVIAVGLLTAHGEVQERGGYWEVSKDFGRFSVHALAQTGLSLPASRWGRAAGVAVVVLLLLDASFGSDGVGVPLPLGAFGLFLFGLVYGGVRLDLEELQALNLAVYLDDTDLGDAVSRWREGNGL